MEKKLIATPAIAGLLIVPIAGYVSWELINDRRFGTDLENPVGQIRQDTLLAERKEETGRVRRQALVEPLEMDASTSAGEAGSALPDADMAILAEPETNDIAADGRAPAGGVAQMKSRLLSAPAKPTPAAPAAREIVPIPVEAESRDRFPAHSDNPVKITRQHPVSTFSIDVDTASYAFVRRSLKEGALPDPDSVRVEEMINYFPYDWPGPRSADVPFNASVTVTPAPWNADTRLMHIGIKGYEVIPDEKPRANLVFLIDVSGSMDAPDKLPLLKKCIPDAGEPAVAGRYGGHRHLCRQRRCRARTDKGFGAWHTSDRDRRGCNPAARRPAKRGSELPIAWRVTPSLKVVSIV